MSQVTSPSRIVTLAAAAVWLAAAGLLAHVVVGGPVEAPGVIVDRLTAVLVVLVVTVSGIIAVFSTRYLQDDPRLPRFLALLAVTSAGTAVFAAAASLLVLVAGWLVAGAGYCLLLAHRRDLAGGREALRRTAGAFAAGDLALVAAAALALVTVGNLDLSGAGDPGAALVAAGVAGPFAVLVVVAALARCAQLPLHRWLPATVAAPTPVCALLHAGLVNAGGILLVRLGPVTGMSGFAAHLLFVAGAATALYAGAVMLTRADVKGALAHSTMAQMGFMLVQVALGAFAAAVVHLVGHAMYKAALFLGSGSAVAAKRRRAADLPGRPVGAPARALTAVALPLAALATAVVLAGGLDPVGGTAALVLLAFAWASGAHAVDGWLRSGPPAAVAAAAAATALAAGAYVGLLVGAKAFLAPGLAPISGVEPWLAAPLVLAVVAATLARVLDARGLGATAYAWATDAGGTRLAPRTTRRRRPGLPALPVRRPAEVTS